MITSMNLANDFLDLTLLNAITKAVVFVVLNILLHILTLNQINMNVDCQNL